MNFKLESTNEPTLNTTINSTFPVIHGLQHPLVVGFLNEDPVTTHTVRRVVSESLLHRYAGVISKIQNRTEASAA